MHLLTWLRLWLLVGFCRLLPTPKADPGVGAGLGVRGRPVYTYAAVSLWVRYLDVGAVLVILSWLANAAAVCQHWLVDYDVQPLDLRTKVVLRYVRTDRAVKLRYQALWVCVDGFFDVFN